MIFCMRVEILLAYFLLKPETEGIPQKRKIHKLFFFSCILARYSNFMQKFFLSDKKNVQIQAIHASFFLSPSSWSWNMKRAIERQICDLRKNGKCFVDLTGEDKALSLIDTHSLRSSVNIKSTGKQSIIASP